MLAARSWMGLSASWGGTFLKRICTIAWCLTGLAALAYYRGQVDDPDHVYGLMASEFLPQIASGLLGLFSGWTVGHRHGFL